jgi:hypothetical protein
VAPSARLAFPIWSEEGDERRIADVVATRYDAIMARATRILHFWIDVMTVLSAALCLAVIADWMLGTGLFRIDIDRWRVIIVFATLPALRCAKRYGVRPRPAGYCAACGYDLRATPHRCPECGTVPASPPPNAPARSPAHRSR